MVADPLREKVEMYRWELERADRLLVSPYLPEELRPKLERARHNMAVLLQAAEDRLEARERRHRRNRSDG